MTFLPLLQFLALALTSATKIGFQERETRVNIPSNMIANGLPV